MSDGDLLTTEEALEHLGVSRATLFNLLKRHRLPTYKIPLRGNRSFYRREDLDKLKEPIRREAAS